MNIVYFTLWLGKPDFHNRRSTTCGKNIPISTRPEVVELLMYRLSGGRFWGISYVSRTRSSLAYGYENITLRVKFYTSNLNDFIMNKL